MLCSSADHPTSADRARPHGSDPAKTKTRLKIAQRGKKKKNPKNRI